MSTKKNIDVKLLEFEEEYMLTFTYLRDVPYSLMNSYACFVWDVSKRVRLGCTEGVAVEG
jgi:hypothetical protein